MVLEKRCSMDTEMRPSMVALDVIIYAEIECENTT